MPKTTKIVIGLACILISACAGGLVLDDETHPSTPTPSPAPWEPMDGDDNLIRGEVFINEAQILILESDQHQYQLSLSGALPTPCHQLRVLVPEPDDQDQIWVEVYSLSDPAEICIQVLEPFEVSIPLGEYSRGEYEVLVNGESIGSIKP